MLWLFAGILIIALWFLRPPREGAAVGKTMRQVNTPVFNYINYPGNDISGPTYVDISECRKSCLKDPTCVQMVTNTNEGQVMCYKKNTIGEPIFSYVPYFSSIFSNKTIYEGSALTCDNMNGTYRYMGHDTISLYPTDAIATSWDPTYALKKKQLDKFDCTSLKKGGDLAAYAPPVGWTTTANSAIMGSRSVLGRPINSSNPEACIQACKELAGCEMATLDPLGKCVLRKALVPASEIYVKSNGSTVYSIVPPTTCPTGPDPLNNPPDNSAGYIY